MFQTFISRHNSNFFSDKLVLTSVTPASSAPVLQTPKATSSTLYFDSLTVNAGNGGFLHCIQMDTSVNAANQVVSVGADIAFDADPKFFACLVRFESSSVPSTLPTAYDVYPLDGRHDGGYFDFLTSNKVWIATDRSRARRCVEACVYGTLDFVGYPRFPAPVEFIAAVIAYYVHPVNIQTACLIMEGAEFTENIINGVERPVKAAELFAFTLRVRAGNTDVLTDAEENVRQKLRAEGVM